MTLFILVLVVVAVYWLVTPHDDARPRRRRGPERPWSRSSEWLDKLRAQGDAKKKRDAEEATRRELRDLEQKESEGAEIPSDVARAVERAKDRAKREGRG